MAAIQDGSIPACHWVKQAVARQLRDLGRVGQVDWPWHFDDAHADSVVAFMEAMPHVKGTKFAGKPFILSDWQCFIMTTVFGWLDSEGMRRFRTVYCEVPRKNGKALEVTTPILTTRGWKEHGQLRVGDWVFAPDGKPVRVEAVTDHYQGPCRQVDFSDCESIIAHDNHEWLTERTWYTGRQQGSRAPLPVVETKQLAATLRMTDAKASLVHRIPITHAVQLPAQPLLLDPYVLGVWLGDGTSSCAYVTTADQEIVDNIRAAGYPCRYKSNYLYALNEPCGKRDLNSVNSKLRALKVLNNKHIPQAYLLGSHDQRLALLQGLIDTDGTVTKAGQAVYYSTSKQLADDVTTLIRSLGMKPTVFTKRAALNGKDCGICYQIQFWAREGTQIARLTRKLQRVRYSTGRALRRMVTGADSCGERIVNCIQVQGGLYLAGRGLVTTHNSSMTAPVGLFCLTADGEIGAEVYSAATTRDQAKIVWGDAKAMTLAATDFRRYLGVKAMSHAIIQPGTNSTFKALSRDNQGNLDGLNVHCALIDELHGHKTRDIWDVLETATGARDQPLMWAITTAGSNRAGICYEQRNYVTKLLDNVFEDDTYFGIIYTLDKDDIKRKDFFRPEMWAKANPNYGISVKPDDLARKAHKAQQTPSALANFLTKHLNVWVNADAPWMSMAAWDMCADSDLVLENFTGTDCILVGDLATKTDILPLIKLFKKTLTQYNSRGVLETADHYYVFGDYYLPQAAIEDGRNSQYPGWAEQNMLHVVPGDVTDFAVVEEKVKEDAKVFKILQAGFDPWQASYLMQRLSLEKLPVLEYRQTVQNMSLPMKELEALVLQRRIHHNGDPVLTWMISNVVCHMDAKDNMYPRKEKPDNKIDGAVALIMGIGITMAPVEAPKQYQAIFL